MVLNYILKLVLNVVIVPCGFGNAISNKVAAAFGSF